MIDELETLEETIQYQNQTILHLSGHLDDLVTKRDKIRGLIVDYEAGRITATMLISYLRMYVR